MTNDKNESYFTKRDVSLLPLAGKYSRITIRSVAHRHGTGPCHYRDIYSSNTLTLYFHYISERRCESMDNWL